MANLHRATNTTGRLTLGRQFASLAALMFLLAAGARAQQTNDASLAAVNQGTQIPQTAAPPTANPEGAGSHTLHLLVGRSLVISSPTPIKRVSVADPNIVEAVVVSPYQLLLNGKTPGGVSLLVWDESDQSQTFEVSVDIDILSLNEKIHEVFPTEGIQLETSKDVVMLSGRISSAAVAEKILEIVKNSTPKVTSLMQFPPIQVREILLEVKFAEVDRTAVSQLGVNILRNFGSNMPLSVTTQQFSPPGYQNSTPAQTSSNGVTTGATPPQFTISNLMNIAVFRPDINMAAIIEALQANNILQILAEPNLLTESGKQASFLAGGEFPVPIVQGSVAGGVAPITIQFKEFGIRLNFTPTLMADGLIHLNVKPEVSSLDYTNAITISGTTIPALSTRRAESDMELKDGQSFAIAGLIDNQVTEQMNKIPGISSIPILGKLFESRSLSKSKDELLIVVTPRIVQPLNPENLPAGPVFPRTFLGPAKPAPEAAPNPK
jgi:pilus assembly protein CpaC